MAGKLSFMVGLARSGKSTFANRWVKEPDPDGLNRVIICADDFRIAMYGRRFCKLAEPHVWATVDTATRALYNRGFHVLSDEVNSTKFRYFKNFDIDPSATPIWFPSINNQYAFDTDSEAFSDHIEECQQRAIQTDQEDLIPVIERQANELHSLLEYLIWSQLPF